MGGGAAEKGWRGVPMEVHQWYSTDMTTHTQPRDVAGVNARSLLFPYAIGLLGSMTVVQVVIAATGGSVGVLAEVLTAVVAVALVIWLWRMSGRLKRIRFGMVIAHALAFVIITTSYNLHALIRTFVLAGGPDGQDLVTHMWIGSAWFGATLGMTALWGVGLTLHLVGVVLGRGWED